MNYSPMNHYAQAPYCPPQPYCPPKPTVPYCPPGIMPKPQLPTPLLWGRDVCNYRVDAGTNNLVSTKVSIDWPQFRPTSPIFSGSTVRQDLTDQYFAGTTNVNFEGPGGFQNWVNCFQNLGGPAGGGYGGGYGGGGYGGGGYGGGAGWCPPTGGGGGCAGWCPPGGGGGWHGW
jgi:hypothetical protein